jgi:hypothetical protein
MQDRSMFFSLKIKALALITSLAMPLAFVQSSQLDMLKGIAIVPLSAFHKS